MFGYNKQGRRFVLTGDTRVAPKGTLGKYGLGLNWDRDTVAWWTGKEELAQKAVDFLTKQLAKRDQVQASACTFTKRGDSWLVRVPDAVQATAGQKVEVRKASGDTKSVELGAVHSREQGFVLYETARKRRAHRSRREDCRKYGWDGVYGSPSYYTSGQYDEDS